MNLLVGNNIAYIDGQNIYLGTNTHQQTPWKINLHRFRVYLSEKYHVTHAYYYLGFLNQNNERLYDTLQEAGFIVKFREHNSLMASKKKGNVDSDIIFDIMHRLYNKDIPNKIVLVSGDGDYWRLVDFLIEENRLYKILLPNQEKSSSLYKKIDNAFLVDLSSSGVRRKIEIVHKKKRAA